MPHWRCIRLYLPQRRITRLIRAAKAAHLLLKETAFIGLRFARNLDVLSNYRYPLRLIHALNQRPRGTPILIGAAQAKPGHGENEKSPDWSLLRTGRFKIFAAAGVGQQVARGTPGLTQAAFTPKPVLCYFLH